MRNLRQKYADKPSAASLSAPRVSIDFLATGGLKGTFTGHCRQYHVSPSTSWQQVG
ncbi:hypothetical protein H6F86_29310 [Phormidium sp. FACHB-592]|uniref:Uncharacterized protein n=1 Tax=Stenomitos frigidus AS-A4 TaxID=2933935 RepID=A0ABV0KQY2_9CYAN|nr:hypothetical protein [Phormidium sp. FACHB-592]